MSDILLDLMSFRPGHGPVQVCFNHEIVAERLSRPTVIATRSLDPAVAPAQGIGLAAAMASSWRETGTHDPGRIAEIASGGLERRAVPMRDPFDPRVGKWAAVVLREDTDAAKQALGPLLELRANEGVAFDAGPDPGYLVIDRPAADKPFLWEEALREAAGAPPQHLLLIGGPDRFPFEVVSWWSTRRIVGVLDVADDPLGPLSWNAVHRYACKLRARAAEPAGLARRALVYAFHTDAATRRSYDKLAMPLLHYLAAQTRRLPAKAQSPISLLGDAATTHNLLEMTCAERPALVVTCTHGIEYPADLNLWGALTSVDHSEPQGCPLSVDALAGQPFADSGVVFAFACFSAGIPGKSAVIEMLSPGQNEPAQVPRIAPLPRFVLGQEHGPVAFIGHVDRATSGSYAGFEATTAFEDLADFVLGGLGTVGQGMSTFWEMAGRAAYDLVAALRPDAASTSQQKVAAWVRNLDTTGWLLLGDPCVRLFPGPDATLPG